MANMKKRKLLCAGWVFIFFKIVCFKELKIIHRLRDLVNVHTNVKYISLWDIWSTSFIYWTYSKWKSNIYHIFKFVLFHFMHFNYLASLLILNVIKEKKLISFFLFSSKLYRHLGKKEFSIYMRKLIKFLVFKSLTKHGIWYISVML